MSFQNHQLKFFADFIQKKLGIIYEEHNYFQLQHRLDEIRLQLGFSTEEEMWTKAQGGISGMFQSLLIDIATNNETSFYRDPVLFNALAEHMVPEVLKAKSTPTIRIWCCASSSGQEPYTIAMALDANRSKYPAGFQYSILATDISDRILKRAEEGVYSQLEVQRGLPVRNLITYFEKGDENSWKVKSEIRKLVQFKKLNLLESFSDIGNFDIIFCRNVLIYQGVDQKKVIVGKIVERLNQGGFFALGAAESLLGLTQAFDQTSSHSAVYYRKK